VENYFNYFTEIEECFQRARQTKTLLSPLDWALIESWKEAHYPLAAVLAGIERCFEKYRARPRQYRKVNSLAYCAAEVVRAVEEARADGSASRQRGASPGASLASEEIDSYMSRNAQELERASRLAEEGGNSLLAADLAGIASSLRAVSAREAGNPLSNLEQLENCLTALEEKLAAALTHAAEMELLARFRQEVERGLIPYRRKMSAAQVESLERQFLKKRLFEHYHIPRLSLFYL
jgi:hypothetical protein